MFLEKYLVIVILKDLIECWISIPNKSDPFHESKVGLFGSWVRCLPLASQPVGLCRCRKDQRGFLFSKATDFSSTGNGDLFFWGFLGLVNTFSYLLYFFWF